MLLILRLIHCESNVKNKGIFVNNNVQIEQIWNIQGEADSPRFLDYF